MSIENDNPVDADISDLYRATQAEDGPSAALDAAILAEAEAATKPRVKRPVWIAPVGLAATVLLGVNLAMNLKDYSDKPDVYSETDTVVSAKKSESVVLPDLAGDTTSTPSEAKTDLSDDLYQYELEDLGKTEASPDAGALVDPGKEESKRESAAFGISPAAPQVSAQSAPQASNEIAKPATRPRLPTPDNSRVETELETDQDRSADAIAQRVIVASGSRTTSQPDTRARVLTEQQVAEEVARQMMRTTGNRAAEPLDEGRLSLDLPVIESTTSNLNPQSTSAPAPRADELNEESELQEVIVTGARSAERDDSPHRRLNAKDQVAKINGENRNNVIGDTQADTEVVPVAAPPSDMRDTYFCDLAILKIDDDAVEQAKTDALTLEPPLNGVTWPDHIRELAENHDFTTACTHLIAFRKLFPDMILMTPLPVTLPPVK